MATNIINRRTIIELENRTTGKVYIANCLCCAKSKLLEKSLFEDIPAIYLCTKSDKNQKKSAQHILADLNYCCKNFELCRDFIVAGYRVVGKYSTKRHKG